MKKMSLNGTWTMEGPAGEKTAGSIPGSVYSFLLEAGKMEDPFYRDNELEALRIVDDDFTFRRSFDVEPELLAMKHQVLRFDGIDTIADVYLNGELLGHTENMHRTWEYDVAGILKENGNDLHVCIKSPTGFIAEADKAFHIGGTTDAMTGFPQLRKAHCMFGWDWGPRLPDEGIWRDVALLGWEDARIGDVRISQTHMLANGRISDGQACAEHARAAREKGGVRVQLTVRTDDIQGLSLNLTAPTGETWEMKAGEPFEIPDPLLWWPNGLGDQPLYTLRVELTDGEDVEVRTYRIGLRTLTVSRKKDQWGETFALCANGQTFFSMGADYIPEDNLLSRITPERTAKLVADCRKAHFNTIRVWGGGYYPDDFFYDLCDENGLVVWQDMMFACANYSGEDAFVANYSEEIRQNVRRIRHHASLGILCGNNEMEQFAAVGVFDGDKKTAADYLIQNEYIIPQIMKMEAPDILYWPSSPSSGGKFDQPSDPDRGDVHYWEVWHGGLPFTAYRQFCFRYLSEFGFQSFPCLETVKSFTEPEDRNIFSYIMEMHQRNSGANGKIMTYLALNFRYPTEFATLLYASQILQAEAIRYGVEHFRRNRNDDRCMGAVYWQLNDIWPVASWASIDYFGRWKALHYYAKRFFAPVLLSCEEYTDTEQQRTCISQPARTDCHARLCMTNETWEEVCGRVEWELRDPLSEVLASGHEHVCANAFSSLWLNRIDLSHLTQAQRRRVHLTYRMIRSGQTETEPSLSGSVLFVPAKHYEFADPELTLSVSEDGRFITVHACAYAKSVEVYAENGYVRLEDNYFDMEKGSRTLQILEGDAANLKVRSVCDIR